MINLGKNFYLILSMFFLLEIQMLQANLITDGKFDDYILDKVKNNLQFPFEYTNMNSNESSWYIVPLTASVRMVGMRNILVGQTNHLLEIAFLNFEKKVCHNIALHKGTLCNLQFDYVIDPNIGNGILEIYDIYESEKLLFSFQVNNTESKKFSEDFVISSQTLALCFLGKSSFNDGIMIDNVTLTKVQFVAQQLGVSLNENPLELIVRSNLSSFLGSAQFYKTNSSILIDGQPVEIVQVFFQDFLLVYRIKIRQQYYRGSLLSLTIDSQTFRNSNYEKVVFIKSETSNLPPMTYINETLLWDEQRIYQAFKASSLSISAVQVFGVTLFVFKFISFANLMILYIFLDIPIPVKGVLQSAAEALLKDSILQSFYQLVSKKKDLFDFQEDQIQKRNSDIQTQGSQLSLIDYSFSIQSLCLQDVIIALFNIIEIVIFSKVWKLGSASSSCCCKNISKFQIRESYLYQLLALSPLWNLAAGFLLGKINLFSFFSFKTKINCIIILSFPLLSLYCLLIIFQTKRSQIMMEVKNTKKKKKEQKKKGLFRLLFQFLDELHFVFLGFLIGLQHIKLFFTVISFYQVYYCIMLFREREISWSYVLLCVRKSLKITVHLIFLLFYIANLMLNKGVSIQWEKGIHEIRIDSSITLLYIFIAGSILQLLLVFGNIILLIFKLIKKAWHKIIFNKVQQEIKQNLQKRQNNRQNLYIHPKQQQNKDKNKQEIEKKKQQQFTDNLSFQGYTPIVITFKNQKANKVKKAVNNKNILQISQF